jgi:acetyl esterase
MSNNISFKNQLVHGQYTNEMQIEMDRLKDLWAQMEVVDFSQPLTDEVRLADQKLHSVWNIQLQDIAEVRHVKIPGNEQLNAVGCDAVIFTPEHVVGDGIIFYVHGGGWSLCNLKTHEGLMRALANASEKTLVGVHYRLAPQNPYPAGLSDVVSAFRHVQASPQSFGLPSGPIVIAGDSAGANLALATMLHEIQAHRPLPAGALLFYGCYGLDFSTPSYQQYADGHLLTEPVMRKLWNWYLPDSNNHKNPLAVPLTASDEHLKALPPLFLSAAEMDPLASDTFLLKEKLDQLKRTDAIWIEKGVVHGYMEMVFQLEAARRTHTKAADAARQFISNALNSGYK